MSGVGVTSSAVLTAIKKIAASPIVYSPVDKCFMLPGVGRKRGLTRLLQDIMPVAHGEIVDDATPRKKARRSKNDPQPNPTIWKPTTAASHYMKKAAPSCRHAVENCVLERDGGEKSANDNFNTRHGSLIDEQIKLRVTHGRAALEDRQFPAVRGGIDPCAATLLDYFDSRKQRIIATQAPLYSPSLDCATAFDVVTADGTVYEIKSTSVTTPEAIERGDKSYETPRARLTHTALRGTPCSQYGIGQLQLYITCAMVRETTDWEPTEAAVLRVSPGHVRRYDLNEWFKTRADRFRRAIAQRTGQHKRNQRQKRNAIPKKNKT